MWFATIVAGMTVRTELLGVTSKQDHALSKSGNRAI
jgi:hypothetical protein